MRFGLTTFVSKNVSIFTFWSRF